MTKEFALQSRNFGKSTLLNRLRGLRVSVCHPDNVERGELILHLQRFGCRIEACWPPPESISPDIDLTFLAIVPGGSIPGWAIDEELRRPAIIAIVGYENPTIIDSVLRISAEGVVTSPIRQFGLLATIVLSLQIHENYASMIKRVRRLDLKLIGIKQVNEAKLIIMNAKNISEEESYKILREEAMARRVTVERMARTIVEANRIFLQT